MKSLRKTLATGALILGLFLPVFGLAEHNQLEVKCVDQSGKSLSGVKVKVQQIISRKWKDEKSKADGVAHFKKLDDGFYRVMARQDGYSPALYEFVILENGTQKSVTLTFKPGDKDQKLYYEDQELNNKAYNELRQGVTLLQQNKFAEAETLLNSSLQINPGNPETYHNLGIALIQQRKWEPAKRALQRASALATVWARMQEKNKGQKQGDAAANPYQQLHDQLEDLLAKFPVLKLGSEANEALAAENYDLAIAKYQELIKLLPNADAYYNLALAQAHAKRYDDALQSVNKALESKPGVQAYQSLKKQIGQYKKNAILKRANAMLGAGDQALKDKNYAEALAKYKEAEPMVPEKNRAAVYSRIAKAQAGLGQNEQAVASWEKAIEMAPKEASYRRGLAQLYFNEKRYDDAINILADPRASGSETADETLYKLGESLLQKGNTDVAQIAFEKALKVNPDRAELYYELGMIYFYNRRDKVRAGEMLTKYVSIGKNKDHLDNAHSVLVVIKKDSGKKGGKKH